MCLTIPARITRLNADGTAEAEQNGTIRVIALTLLGQAAVGDYVIVQSGFGIRKLDADEAHRALALIREIDAAGPFDAG